MNNLQFTREEEFRAVNAVRELYASLIEKSAGSIGPLHGKTMFPKTVPLTNNIHASSPILYVAAKNRIEQITPSFSSANSTVSTLRVPPHRYLGLHSFRIEGVPYLAAGYSSGIIIVNTQDQAERQHLVFDRNNTSKFNSIGHTGKTLEDTILWGVHSDFGVLRLPLPDLLSNNINSHDYLISLGTSPSNVQPLRICVSQDRVFASTGSTVYQYNPSHQKFDFYSDLAANTISAICVQDTTPYAGTTSGKIYRDGTLWYNVGNPTSAIGKIIALPDQSILFTTLTRNLSGPLQWTDGQKAIVVSSPLSQVHDMVQSSNHIFTVENRIIRSAMIESKSIAEWNWAAQEYDSIKNGISITVEE